MSASIKKPPPPGAASRSSAGSSSGVSSRSPARSTTPSSPSTASTRRAPARAGSTGSPMSARAAVKRPGASSLSKDSPPPVDTAEEDAKAETAALIKDLKEQLQKAEASSDEYKKQIEVLKARLDEAIQDQAKLEERVHEEEERVEGLENDKRETVRQRRELEGIYEAERAAAMKEKEQAQAREDELQEVIQRLKDQLAERERGDGAGDERMERRNSRPLLPERTSSTQNIENGHFAPPSSLQRSDSQNNSKLILQKDKVIESLRLELAEAQIKSIEMENAGGGRVQELEKILLETRMANARLMEDNESFQLLLSEKTLNGDFLRSTQMSRPASSERPNTSLADELGDAVESESHERRLESEIGALKDQNKALTLYINKIIERLLQHQGFEAVLSHDQADAVPPKPTAANTQKELPPPPKRESQGPSLLQRAKSVVGGGGNAPQVQPRPRPVSVMPPPPPREEPSLTSNPTTAPSIPIRHSSGAFGHRRANSEWSNNASSVVNNMYRGNGPMSPNIVSPRNSLFNFPNQPGDRNSGSRIASGSSSVPRASIDEEGSGHDSLSNTDSAVAVDGAPSPPRSVASSADRPGQSVMTGNKPRPLRLVRETEEAEKERKAANRQSIFGWFGGK
ncbi:hypothetical protein HDK77DRAFT_306178 [Phyllosticta capitalensis]|uniref:Uncharacterized protein n=2 Tax=Phyllosticta capitalensis TaxID=121624 RepID=A0ABR1YDR6_9PEZI